tara:strand:- start:14362 stop:16020 length:1659 start_codon:yes stop_codon:yes gene_type:complete
MFGNNQYDDYLEYNLFNRNRNGKTSNVFKNKERNKSHRRRNISISKKKINRETEKKVKRQVREEDKKLSVKYWSNQFNVEESEDNSNFSFSYNNSKLSSDMLVLIFNFLGIHTLLYVLPYVCRHWRNACSLFNIDTIMYEYISFNMNHTNGPSSYQYYLYNRIDIFGSLNRITSIFRNIKHLKCNLFNNQVYKANHRQIFNIFSNLNCLEELTYDFTDYFYFSGYTNIQNKTINYISELELFLEYLARCNIRLRKLNINYFNAKNSNILLEMIDRNCKFIECLTFTECSIISKFSTGFLNLNSLSFYYGSSINRDTIRSINNLQSLKYLEFINCISDELGPIDFNKRLGNLKLKRLVFDGSNSSNNDMLTIINSKLIWFIILNSLNIEELSIDYYFFDFDLLFKNEHIISVLSKLSITNMYSINDNFIDKMGRLINILSHNTKFKSLQIKVQIDHTDAYKALMVRDIFKKVDFDSKLIINNEHIVDKYTLDTDIVTIIRAMNEKESRHKININNNYWEEFADRDFDVEGYNESYNKYDYYSSEDEYYNSDYY